MSRSNTAGRRATPIVFFGGGDPVNEGLVASLARPGGNLTGVSVMASELMPKRLELLSELVAHTVPVGLLINPNNGITQPMIPDMQEAARMKGMQILVLKADSEAEIDAAFATLVQQHAGGVVAPPTQCSTTDVNISWLWRHTMPFQRSISHANLSPSVA